MSSYYPSFSYLGVNSRDRNLVVAHFDADQGETETFMSMEPIYTESADGSRRLDYGAKYNNVATFRITVIKPDNSDFSVAEVREHLKWLTGSRKNSTLDFLEHFTDEFVYADADLQLINQCDKFFNVYVNDNILNGNTYSVESSKTGLTSISFPLSQPSYVNNGDIVKIAYGRIKYSFVGRVTNAWQYKMDARTIGLVLEFTSVSPWAYSAPQVVTETFNESVPILINNYTDDLYGYTPVNVTFKNARDNGYLQLIGISDHAGVGEYLFRTLITDLSIDEVVTINDNMIITSDKPNKVFGDSFNFDFPKLCAGKNTILLDGAGQIEFSYVYCIKIGDCAMDINATSASIYDDDGQIQVDTLPFSRITDLPNTFQAYNIQNVYSKTEVDEIIAGFDINENELSAMLLDELN